MQPVAFCNRCRGMKVGFNGRYIVHCLSCKDWMSRSVKLFILMVLLSTLIYALPTPSTFVPPPGSSPAKPVVQQASMHLTVPVVPNPAVRALTAFLNKYQVAKEHRDRVAEAIVASGRKYNLDPRLVASIMIVESRANPFAISTSDAIGIMQIHLPTWGRTADKEDINLFKIEDNVDFGVRILRDYVRRYGIWDGVKRYRGWNSEIPESTQSADEYVQKVQRIYSHQPQQ
jgi:hypothetical protein